MKNDLLKTVWPVRDQIGAECGYDMKRIAALSKRAERMAGRRKIRSAPAPRRNSRSPIPA